MLFHLSLLYGGRRFFLLMLLFAFGVQFGHAQEPDKAASWSGRIREHLRSAVEARHKEIVELARSEFSKTKNVDKDKIKFVNVRQANDGWFVRFYIDPSPPDSLLTIYVSGDKKTVKIVPTSR